MRIHLPMRSYLVLLLVAIAGCSSKPPQTGEEWYQASANQLRDSLLKTVKDQGRLQQMLALVDKEAADLQLGVEEFARLREEEARLDADYNTTPDQLRKVGDRLQAVRLQYRAQLIQTRMALAQLATDAEWKEITSRNLAVFKYEEND